MNMVDKKALLVGASGLTGGHLLNLLLQSDDYKTVIVYVRKSLQLNHPKLIEKIIDFETFNASVEADDIFCCLGTTIKKAGSKQAFIKVDLDFPLKLAKLQMQAGSSKFLIVSAMGAASNAFIFYSQVKGRLEERLKTIGFPALFIFRPSLITGNRIEKRVAEKISIVVFKFINPLFIGPLKKYRSVSAEAIAKAMLYYANNTNIKSGIILSDEIKRFE